MGLLGTVLKAVAPYIILGVILVIIYFVFKDSINKFINSSPLGLLMGNKVARKSRVADCPDTYTNNGLTCGRTVKSKPESSTLADCPDDYMNAGLGCVRKLHEKKELSTVANCPKGYTNNGATCGRGIASETLDKGKGKFITASCPPGYKNMGATCYRGSDSFGRDPFAKIKGKAEERCEKQYGKDNCQSSGLYYYPTCKAEATYLKKDFADKYTNMGLTCLLPADTLSGGNEKMECKDPIYSKKNGGLCYIDCEKTYGDGFYNNGSNCRREASTKGMDIMTCPDGKFKTGARCYTDCQKKYGKEYKNIGEMCVIPPDKPLGMDKMICPKDKFKTGSRCYIDCKKKYGEDWKNDGEFCTLPTSTKGLESMKCKVNEKLLAGRCYANCDDGFEPDSTGLFCNKK